MKPRSVVPPDQFEVFNELARGRRFGRVTVVLSLLLSMFSMFIAFVAFLRPVVVVDRGTNPLEPARLATAGDAAVREVDAQRFFINTAKLLYGWDSVSVTKVLTQEVPYVMTAPWRERFRAELNAPVSVPVEYDPSGKMSQLSSYIAAKVQNEVEVDFTTLKCAMNPETKLWSCKGRVLRRTQPLFGPPLDDPKLLKRLVIRATFKPVPITVDTIDGLLVDFWDASEPE